MIDPASAIGLAASIIEVIRSTKSILSKSSELYNSSQGALIQNIELETVASSFEKLIKDLARNVGGLEGADNAELKIIQLAKDVDSIVRRLTATLRAVKTGSKAQAWQSIWQSLRSILKEEELRSLEISLDRYRKQIDTALLVSLR
jgi:hypothetical protein